MLHYEIIELNILIVRAKNKNKIGGKLLK